MKSYVITHPSPGALGFYKSTAGDSGCTPCSPSLGCETDLHQAQHVQKHLRWLQVLHDCRQSPSPAQESDDIPKGLRIKQLTVAIVKKCLHVCFNIVLFSRSCLQYSTAEKQRKVGFPGSCIASALTDSADGDRLWLEGFFVFRRLYRWVLCGL